MYEAVALTFSHTPNLQNITLNEACIVRKAIILMLRLPERCSGC